MLNERSGSTEILDFGYRKSHITQLTKQPVNPSPNDNKKRNKTRSKAKQNPYFQQINVILKKKKRNGIHYLESLGRSYGQIEEAREDRGFGQKEKGNTVAQSGWKQS